MKKHIQSVWFKLAVKSMCILLDLLLKLACKVTKALYPSKKSCVPSCMHNDCEIRLHRVQKRWHHKKLFSHFSIDTMYRWSMMKNIHSPNLVGISSLGPEIWPHEYLISPIEIRYSCGHILGPPWTNPCQIWCVRVFFIMFYWNMVMKMLKCKKENLMKSQFSTLLMSLPTWNCTGYERLIYTWHCYEVLLFERD